MLNRRALVVLLFALAAIFSAAVNAAYPRDLDGRYAASPLKGWFDSLRSGKGPCCSDADGTALADVDWRSDNGHYAVRIDGVWIDVPDEAVLREPNKDGRTIVWPIPGIAGTTIRCFIAGSMT